MLVRIYGVYCLWPRGSGLLKHTALSKQLDGFNSCRRDTPLLYPAGPRRCWQSDSIHVSCLVNTACVHLSHFPLFSFSLSWVGSVNVWGSGLAFTRRCDQTVIFYLIKNRRVFQKLLAGPGPPGAQLEIRG